MDCCSPITPCAKPWRSPIGPTSLRKAAFFAAGPLQRSWPDHPPWSAATTQDGRLFSYETSAWPSPAAPVNWADQLQRLPACMDRWLSRANSRRRAALWYWPVLPRPSTSLLSAGCAPSSWCGRVAGIRVASGSPPCKVLAAHAGFLVLSFPIAHLEWPPCLALPAACSSNGATPSLAQAGCEHLGARAGGFQPCCGGADEPDPPSCQRPEFVPNANSRRPTRLRAGAGQVSGAETGSNSSISALQPQAKRR